MVEGWSTVQVANLPLETTRGELENVFSELGPIKKCFVLKPKEGKKSNLGFVTFAMSGDCKAAAERDDLELNGNTLKLTVKPDKKDWNAERPAKQINSSSIAKNKARLIVRNLSFKADEDALKNHFSKHGQIVDVNILKKADGRMVGCAFVEFKKVTEATNALKDLNSSQMLGRTIAVDWAVPKEMFNDKKKTNEVKEETAEVKEEIKEEVSAEGEDEDSERVSEWIKEEEGDEEADSDDEDEDDDEGDEDDEEEGEDEKEKKNIKAPKPAHNLKAGHDIGEGKTVFIRNLSYDSEEHELKVLMEENFGRVAFAKLVMDKVMGHPRGTAFVKFLRKDDAAKAIHEASPEGEQGIFLAGRRLQVMLAQNKEEVEQKQKSREEEKKEGKDQRNLYLAREGMVREGTQAAEGVSASDMAKRKVVEKQKKHLLKNLNMFVSSTRLCIRNLPPSVDDSKLKSLIVKNVPKTAKVTECKVMRDLASGNGGKKAPSKEYAFVSFEKHLDALEALRNVNNNPTIFTKDRRPIVEFSIENRKALLARQKRLEKSREKNPNISEEKKKKLLPASKKLSVKADKTKPGEGAEKNQFSGLTSDPKQKGLPSHSGAKVRTNREKPKISRKDLRKREEERKNPKLKQKRKNADILKENLETTNGPPDPKKAKKEKKKAKKISAEALKEKESEKKFASLVGQYKSTLQNNSEVRKKWFE